MVAVNKTRVCLFDFEPIDDFHGYEIHTFDPFGYIGASRRGGLKLLISTDSKPIRFKLAI